MSIYHSELFRRRTAIEPLLVSIYHILKDEMTLLTCDSLEQGTVVYRRFPISCGV